MRVFKRIEYSTYSLGSHPISVVKTTRLTAGKEFFVLASQQILAPLKGSLSTIRGRKKMKNTGHSALLRTLIISFALTVCIGASAGPLSWFARSPLWPWGWPDTLLVTGNFAESRLLGEVAQLKTKQPLIIISPEADGNHIYYFPYKESKALELKQEEYLEFIETMLRPKKIVFLGGDDIVAKDFSDAVKANYTALTLKGDDWTKNAKQLGKIMHCWTLKSAFVKAQKKFKEGKAHRETYDTEAKTIPVTAGE